MQVLTVDIHIHHVSVNRCTQSHQKIQRTKKSKEGNLDTKYQNSVPSVVFTKSVLAGVTLRENNLKELEGGHIMWSQGVLVANKRALKERPGLLEVVHELIERFEAHLEAGKYYNVLANMRGDSAAEVPILLAVMLWWVSPWFRIT